jgi:hypothetical protein
MIRKGYDVDNFFETLSHHSFYRFLLVEFVLKLNLLRLTCQESKENATFVCCVSVVCQGFRREITLLFNKTKKGPMFSYEVMKEATKIEENSALLSRASDSTTFLTEASKQ